MKVTFAVLDKNGKNVADRVLDVLEATQVWQPPNFGVICAKASHFEKSIGVLRRQGLDSSAIAGYASSQSRVASDYEFLQINNTALLFEGNVYSPISLTAVTKHVAKDPLHCETVLHTLIEQADGDYAFYLLKDRWIAAARDPMGVQPLYYGENKDIAAFATNRSTLWKLGIEKPLSFPPGSLCFADSTGFKFRLLKTLTYNRPITVTLDDAAKALQTLLKESIRRRVDGLKEVAVAFSGGLDSSVVAFLASKCGVRVALIHVSLENQAETEKAIEAADALNLPMQMRFFKDSDVEKILPEVIALIEEPDPIKAAIGVPFYWTAECAARAGFKVLLAGQGADELFGGYQRYVVEYCKNGNEKAMQIMFNDIVGIYESNLERDLKITSRHGVKLRLPFASYDLATFAMRLPIECKMEQKPETLRKLVLRKVALNAGVPARIAEKPKKAVQYSTGINDAIKRIAKKQEKTVSQYVSELFEQSKL